MLYSVKYNEFYLINDNSTHNLSELFDMDDTEYLCKYDGNMYCPLCRKAQLARVRRENNTFLRTYKGQRHGLVNGEPCDYSFDRKSLSATEKYIKELKAGHKLKSKLESLLLQLKKRDIVRDVIDESMEKLRPEPLKSISVARSIRKRAVIPMYSFLNWGNNTPQNTIIIAYGDVYISVIDNALLNTHTYLHLFSDDTKARLLTSFLKPYKMNITDGYYHVVAAGTCVQNGRYYNFKVFDFNEGILIEPINKTLKKK